MAKKLTKRADGRYAKQVNIGIKDGKPVKKTIYGKTLKELDNNYIEFMSLKNKGIIIDNNNITIPELAKEWYKLKKQPKITKHSPNTKNKTTQEYDVRIRQIERLFEGVKVKDSTEYTIESKLNEVCAEGKTSTAQTTLGILKKVFNYAIRLSIIYTNPCLDIEIEHVPKKNRALTEIERKQTEKAELSDFDKAMLFTLRYTGMRIGECIALEKTDIDFKNMKIKIWKNVFDDNGKPKVQFCTKTGAGIREVPILDLLVEPLQKWINSMPKNQTYLFLNRNGNIFSTNSLSWVIRRWKKQTGIGQDVTFHTFRHNFVTECFYAEISLAKVQKWVGHSDYSTTMNIYNHLSHISFEDGEEMNNFYKNKSKTSQKAKAENNNKRKVH